VFIPSQLIILRGLPGSGKSTIAQSLSEENKYPVFSIDDYFTDSVTKEYLFDFSKNHLAYKLCEINTEKAMQENCPKIFLHNTFTIDWEIEPYFALAKKYNYTVFVLTVEKHHQGENIHGVSEEQIKKMAEKYKVKLL
jgi:predicted kinase